MSIQDSLVCKHCGTNTTYTWVKGIQYICSHCKKEINLYEAILDGRYNNTNELQKNFDKKKKK